MFVGLENSDLAGGVFQSILRAAALLSAGLVAIQSGSRSYLPSPRLAIGQNDSPFFIPPFFQPSRRGKDVRRHQNANPREGRPSMLTVVAVLAILLTSCVEKKEEKPAGENTRALASNSVGQLTVAPPKIDTTNLEEGKIFQQICFQCHGEKGEGKEELRAPSIGGLPEWYVIEQTEKFRSGLRGAHPKDIYGQLMRGITLALTPEQVKNAALYNERLPGEKTRQRGREDSIDRGRYSYANKCMACHRYNGKGEIVFHSAPLTTLNIEYLERQLKKYRNGWRGNAENDLYGRKMIDVARLMDDREIEDVVNYIGALAHGDDPRPAME